MADPLQCTRCKILTYQAKPGEACFMCDDGQFEAQPTKDGRRTGANPQVNDKGSLHPDNWPTPTADPDGLAGKDRPLPPQPTPRQPGPKVTRNDAVALWNLLADRHFHKGKDLEMNSRKIRAICAAYPDRFLSTQKGYKRVRDATDDEIENAAADLRSRIRQLAHRAQALDGVLFERKNERLDLK